MSTSSSNSGSSGVASPTRKPLDPIARTALRYTISPREYELLHAYLLERSNTVRKRVPEPKRFEKITSKSKDKEDGVLSPESNVVALRSAVRVFVGVYLGFKGYELVMRKLASRRGVGGAQSKGVKFGNARLALSFSSILLFHKLLHRFFKRLRVAVLKDEAESFRKRNPKVAELLTSSYTPAVGAALSGLLLGISPADQLRVTIAIYVFARSLEFSYNTLESSGYLWKSKADKPWWFGSWMLMPFACGQLLHSFAYDRDCFPASYGSFILRRSPEYIRTRPVGYPSNRPWPGTFDIVDALASLSKLNWHVVCRNESAQNIVRIHKLTLTRPPFLSPILFPKNPLPTSVAKIHPITSSANPGLKYTSCALLHPREPSCTRNFFHYFAAALPGNVRFFGLIYGAFALLGIKSAMKDPITFINRLSVRILRMAVFITGAIGTSWASICLFNRILPPKTLSTQRFFLGGFLGGMWAFIARHRERGNFLYSARLSIDSLWKVGKKRGWWKGIKNGDVLLFTASLALFDYVYQRQPDAVQGAAIRKAASVMRGEGWIDAVEPESKVGKERLERKEAEEDILGESTVVVGDKEEKKEQ